MYNFASDYLEGAHPQVMEALNKTNFIQTVGYGEDQYCQKAKDKIKAILENENVDIHFLVGGTQTNMIMIFKLLLLLIVDISMFMKQELLNLPGIRF